MGGMARTIVLCGLLLALYALPARGEDPVGAGRAETRVVLPQGAAEQADINLTGDAVVLPKGVAAILVEYARYLPIRDRYDPEGNREPLAADFNRNLNGSVFPGLALVEAAFGMPPGSASLGTSVVDFKYEFADLIVNAYYGVTNRLSIGVKVPYLWSTNKVSASLDTSTATVGLNPAVPGGIAPLAVPGTVPLTAADVQNLLAQNFGVKPVETWSESGFGDIEAGLRYQYFNNLSWKLAFTGGVRFPTGKADDPDNLVDIPFGTGAYALLFRLNNDFTGIRNLVLTATLKYDWVLPDGELLRVPDSPNQVLTNNKEKVDRDIGDVIEIELAGSYAFPGGFGLGGLYRYGAKRQDRISGSLGFNYSSLQVESATEEQIYQVSLSYTTMPLYLKKAFPVPLTASVSYRDRFAGKNNALDSQYLKFGLQFYF